MRLFLSVPFERGNQLEPGSDRRKAVLRALALLPATVRQHHFPAAVQHRGQLCRRKIHRRRGACRRGQQL